MDWLHAADLVKLLQVVFVNLVLSADNAIVVGIAAAGLPVHQRLRVMAIGIAGATVLRIVFALFTVQLLEVEPVLLIVKPELVPSVTAPLLETEKVTPLQGFELSLSLIVPMAEPSLIVAPEGLDSVKFTVSALSTFASSSVETLIVLLVSPIANVSGPLRLV